MTNYPDSVHAGDPDAPWNVEDAEKETFFVTVTVCLEAFDRQDAGNRVLERLEEFDCDNVDVKTEYEI